MSCGLLPPIPDLIPISEFHKNSHHPHQHYQTLNNNRRLSECAPCSVHGEVMGEQRSRRTGKQPAIDLIDTSRSRGLSAAPQAPFRKTRPERHRKSDRRREHRSTGRRKRSGSKQRSRSSRLSTTSPERPVNPRVNPIFVWVRQEDTHIVDVKCEDYDKRNRILLTKTAQGWRAIPRTETLVPTLKEEDDLKNKEREQQQQHPQLQQQPQQQQHRVRKQRKTHKIKRKSTGIQVDEDNMSEAEVVAERPVSPSWSDPVNVESHLPSHTIHITRKPSPDRNVNSSAATNSNNSVENPVIERNINKSCDVTPLDNLLAVAELEFNHQLQSGEWNKCSTDNTTNDDTDVKDKSDDFIDNIELNNFIDSCATTNNENETEEEPIQFNDDEEQQQEESKTEDCDYNEEDDNNLAMDDILNRLEQSLRSPELGNTEVNEMLNECEENVNVGQMDIKDQEEFTFEEKENFNESEETTAEKTPPIKNKREAKDYSTNSAETDTPATEEVDCPTDLSTKNNFSYSEPADDIQPTDLSLPKRKETKSPPPRPSSHSSETIQSPQPSGIPAVPPSPDIFSNVNNKSKSIFLESLLTSACQKNPESSEVAPEKEPLDLGNFRKSASPTVTCSEEVKNKLKRDGEPASKKMKVEDITLKKLLDVTPNKGLDGKIFSSEQNLKETSRLLELLSLPYEQDPVAQLNQILSDTMLNIPDPMLVPKERLSLILSSPGREIPRLLIDRPELRLPQALAFPHLLQDPDILVITLSQLQTIIHKQSQILPLKDLKSGEEKTPINEKRSSKSEHSKLSNSTKVTENKEERLSNYNNKDASRKSGHASELANDIDAATNAAFNQMMWLPYLNQLDNSSFANNNEFLKLLTMLPPYATHTPEMTHLLGMNRFVHPAAFSMQPPFNCNPLEYSTWQEAMLQANLLRPKNQYDMMNPKNFYRDYAEKNSNTLSGSKKPSHYPTKTMHKSNCPPSLYPPSMPYQNHHSSLLSMSSAYQQPTSNRTNIQIPQYNPMLSSQRNVSNANKNKMHHTNTTSASSKQSGNRSELPYSISQSQRLTEENKIPHTSSHSARLIDQHQSGINGNTMKMSSRKPYPHYTNHENTIVGNKHGVSEGPKHHHSSGVTAATMQPIDLSGSTATGSGKLKVRQHLIDPSHTARLLKQDDIPEVGSTTASIEEMQDAQKYLWHPLFGK
ncbi:hypothetical protein Trydic_g8872 [Trypoxylus dichotomus]